MRFAKKEAARRCKQRGERELIRSPLPPTGSPPPQARATPAGSRRGPLMLRSERESNRLHPPLRGSPQARVSLEGSSRGHSKQRGERELIRSHSLPTGSPPPRARAALEGSSRGRCQQRDELDWRRQRLLLEATHPARAARVVQQHCRRARRMRMPGPRPRMMMSFGGTTRRSRLGGHVFFAAEGFFFEACAVLEPSRNLAAKV